MSSFSNTFNRPEAVYAMHRKFKILDTQACN